jgi:ABC-type nitrate/sulfonate/bicarbonate transport system substrate-binding protein
MDIDRRYLTKAALASALLYRASGALAAAKDTVKIGQATTTLGFLAIWAARTFETFPAQGLELSWAAINGGDPATLAALDSGDVDLAATGSDSVLDAVSKGQPYQIIYSLMSKMSLNLTVSTAFIKRTGIAKDQPVADRIKSLKNATIGVAAVGGAQDRTVRWLAGKGGLDPRKDIQVVQIGSATALGAALENGRIDAFMLSAPEGQLAEAGGYGQIYIEPDADFADIKGMPSLVLVARQDADQVAQGRIISALRAINAGSQALLADLDAGADKMGQKFFPKIPSDVLRKSVRSLADGIRDKGILNQERAGLLVKFVVESGRTPPASGSAFWTNRYVESALAPK